MWFEIINFCLKMEKKIVNSPRIEQKLYIFIHNVTIVGICVWTIDSGLHCTMDWTVCMMNFFGLVIY